MRLFIDERGYSYKALEPKSSNDIERMNPSPEQLEGLPDNGSSLSIHEHEKAIRLLPITRMQK